MPCWLFPGSRWLRGEETSAAEGVTTISLPMPIQSPSTALEKWSAVPAVSPPRLLATRRLLPAGHRASSEVALIMHKHCPMVAKALLCYQHGFGRRSTPQHYTGCCEENELCPSWAHCNSLYQTVWRFSDLLVIWSYTDKENFNSLL